MEPSFPLSRGRRWRRTSALRRLVRETALHPSDLVLPLFVREDIAKSRPIESMPGHAQLTLEGLRREADRARTAGIGGVVLFGIPPEGAKDPTGTQARHPEGIVQRAIRQLKQDGGVDDPLAVIGDVCLCEYTTHGHCGLVGEDHRGQRWVENDSTLELIADAAVAQATAGVDVVAPSDMMDGRVGAVRSALDANGFEQVPILSYAAKYASSFYGPFRDAAGSAPQFGDRRGYQMDPANLREALREVRQDLSEGADAVMVKPALAYLDVVREVARETDVPVAAYSVSGEFAMVKAAAEKGWCDERACALEILHAIKRAGAGIILTYWALDAAEWLS